MALLPQSLLALVGRARAVDAPSAEVAVSRNTAAEAVTAAETAVETAETAYKGGLLDADDVAVRALDDARRDAAVRLDRARAVLAAVEAGLAAAEAREHAAQIEAVVRNADEAVAAFRRAVEVNLPKMTDAVREILRLRAHAEYANDAADRLLRAEAGDPNSPQRPPIENFRTWPGRPRRELASTEVELWCWATGEPVDEGKQPEIRVLEDGTGRLETGSTTAKLSFKRRFRRVEFLPVEMAQIPEGLPTALAVPGLTALDRPGWSPEGMKHAGAADILAELKRVERQVEPELDARQPEVRFLPIGDLWDVGEERRAAERRAAERRAG